MCTWPVTQFNTDTNTHANRDGVRGVTLSSLAWVPMT